MTHVVHQTLTTRRKPGSSGERHCGACRIENGIAGDSMAKYLVGSPAWKSFKTRIAKIEVHAHPTNATHFQAVLPRS